MSLLYQCCSCIYCIIINAVSWNKLIRAHQQYTFSVIWQYMSDFNPFIIQSHVYNIFFLLLSSLISFLFLFSHFTYTTHFTMIYTFVQQSLVWSDLLLLFFFLNFKSKAYKFCHFSTIIENWEINDLFVVTFFQENMTVVRWINNIDNKPSHCVCVFVCVCVCVLIYFRPCR